VAVAAAVAVAAVVELANNPCTSSEYPVGIVGGVTMANVATTVAGGLITGGIDGIPCRGILAATLVVIAGSNLGTDLTTGSVLMMGSVPCVQPATINS
jgi:hypothetical protein